MKMIMDESGFTTGLDKAVKNLGKFEQQTEQTGQRGGRSLSGIWSSFVGNFMASGATKIVSKGIGLITENLDGAINRVDTLNNSNRVFENMGFSAKDTSKMMDALNDSITGLPTPLDSAIQGVQLIASSTNDLGKSEKIFAALNNGILGFGGSAEQVDNAVVQLSQSFSNGKVDAQTWNSMINSGLGPALNALAKQMGITSGELKSGLSDGSISADKFQDALIDLNKNGGGGLKSLEQIAKDSTGGIKTGMANMKTAITRGVANLIEGLNKGLDEAGFGSISEIIGQQGKKIEEAFSGFAKKLPEIIKGAKDLYETLKPFAPVFVGLIAGLTTFTAVLKIQQTIGAVTKAFNIWKKATEGATIAQKLLNSTLLANPVALLATVLVGLVASVIYLWKTNEGFRNAMKGIWQGIKDTVTSAGEAIKKGWESVKEFFSNFWEGTKEKFAEAGNWMKELPGKAADAVKEKWSDTKGFFSGLWSDIKSGASGVWDNVTESATSGVDSVKEKWNGVKTWFSDTWQNITETAKEKTEPIRTMFEPLASAWKAVFFNFRKYLENVWTTISTVAKNAWEVIKNVILAPVLFVTSMISGGWEEAKNNMIGVWNNISEAASNIWGAIKDYFVNTWYQVTGSFQSAWYGISETAENVWNAITGKAKEIWNDFKNYFVNLWIDIKYNVKTAWIDLKYTVIDTANNIKTTVINTWESFKQGTIDTFRNIVDGVKNTWSNFKKWIIDTTTAVKNGVVNGWKTLKQNTIDTFNNMVNGAKTAWRNLKQSVSDTIQKVKETFHKLKEINLLDIGKNIIQGLIDGIGEKIQAVKDKIKGVATTIKDGIKGALDIHSPSRWMKKMIGWNIPLGVVEGVEDKKGELDKSIQNMVDLPEINVKTGTSESTSQVANVAKSDNQAKSGDTYHIHLTANGSLSDAELMKQAKTLVKYIKELKDRDDAPQGGLA